MTSHAFSRLGRRVPYGDASFGDQLHTFSCLSILHNAVVAWNTIQIGKIVSQLRGEGQQIEDETLSHVTPLLRKHINPFGRYYFDLIAYSKTRPENVTTLNGGFRLDVATTPDSATEFQPLG